MKKITNENYFDVEGYLSASLFKRFEQCEVGGTIPFGERSDDMLIGSYVDAHVEGTLEEFITKHPEIISSKGATKGELKSGFKNAVEICKYIDENNTLQQFFSGEKQTIWTGKIASVPFKAKLDIYSKGIAINDLKVLKTVTNKQGEFYDFITPWGYDIQLAIYQELVLQNTGEKLPCYICAVTKESPINSVIVNIPQVILDKALYKVECNSLRYYNIMTKKIEAVGCGKCKHCIEQRKGTPIISMLDFVDFM